MDEPGPIAAFLPPEKKPRRSPVQVAVDKTADYYFGLRDKELPQEWALALTLAWVQSGGLVR